jgi:hypothetical protein
MEIAKGRNMKELTKGILIGAVAGGIVGAIYASYTTNMSLYYDCRYAGVTRIGESAFKCEQFSKVVLLVPDTKKEPKK